MCQLVVMSTNFSSLSHTCTTLELFNTSTDIHTHRKKMLNNSAMIGRNISKLTALMLSHKLARCGVKNDSSTRVVGRLLDQVCKLRKAVDLC